MCMVEVTCWFTSLILCITFFNPWLSLMLLEVISSSPQHTWLAERRGTNSIINTQSSPLPPETAAALHWKGLVFWFWMVTFSTHFRPYKKVAFVCSKDVCSFALLLRLFFLYLCILEVTWIHFLSFFKKKKKSLELKKRGHTSRYLLEYMSRKSTHHPYWKFSNLSRFKP